MKPKLKEEFYPNGKVRFQSWHLNEKWHNEGGPALIRYYEDGNVCYQTWYLNEKLHNEEGPAHTAYYKNGKTKNRQWFLNNKQLFKEDFTSLGMIKKMNAFEFFSPLEIARFKI